MSLPLEGHSGSIQAAINLEMSTSRVDMFEILEEGINGQLPNLDLINMVSRLCMKDGIDSKLHTQVGFIYCLLFYSRVASVAQSCKFM